METRKSLIPIYELEFSDGISLKIHVKKAKTGILSIILFFALSIFLFRLYSLYIWLQQVKVFLWASLSLAS